MLKLVEVCKLSMFTQHKSFLKYYIPIQVKEKDSTKKKLQACPFCEKKVTGFAGLEKGSGSMTCNSCKGSGIDSAIGKGFFYISIIVVAQFFL